MPIDVRGLYLIAEGGDCSLPLVRGLVACLVAGHGAHRLSCSVAGGIFMEQGSDSGILHWQADS